MKTPYLDNAIKTYKKALRTNMLSNAGKEALNEYKLIKQLLNKPCEHPYHALIGEEHGNPKCLKCGENL